MTNRMLAKSVNLFSEAEGNVTLDAYTPESEIPEDLREMITNPKAWLTSEQVDAMMPPGLSKRQLLDALLATSEITEEDIQRLKGSRRWGDDRPRWFPRPDETEEVEEEYEDEFEDMNVNELREYAATNEIELGGATRKADIIAAIRTAEAEGAGE